MPLLKRENILKSLVFNILLMSCAGPMNPFGSDIKNLYAPNEKVNTLEVAQSGVEINFFPNKQNWHSGHDLFIILKSKDVPLTINNFRVFWNKKDVTKSLDYEKSLIYHDDHALIVKVSDIRIPANVNNDIFIYYINPIDKSVYGEAYDKPTCQYKITQDIHQTAPFNVKKSFINLVEDEASKKGVNPAMITGLIAQESGFNYQAVSYAKAIGLTQVTNLASNHVVKVHKKWKEDKRIKRYPASVVRAMVKMGKINHRHDWRLNRRKSVIGGIEYLQYLNKYWLGNQDLLERIYGESGVDEELMSDILLASYNSGPARIKSQIIKNGRKWTYSKDIKEALKYIGKVKSFCYHFANNSGGNYENQATHL